MSLKKIEQVKKDKGFKIFDLIIYGVILLTVAVLFIVVFTTRNTSPLTGIKIYVRAEVVFEYEFGGTLPEELDGRVEVKEDDKGITVTVRANEKQLNVIYIDKTKKTAKMKEANCRGGQCKFFPAIDDNNKYIYCDPHGVKVEPFSRDWGNPDIKI